MACVYVCLRTRVYRRTREEIRVGQYVEPYFVIHSFEPLPFDPSLKSRSAPDFIGCLFFDLTVMYAFGNVLFIGANVLQLGGILTFTGCTFLENTMLGVENGLGLVNAQDRTGGWAREEGVRRT